MINDSTSDTPVDETTPIAIPCGADGTVSCEKSRPLRSDLKPSGKTIGWGCGILLVILILAALQPVVTNRSPSRPHYSPVSSRGKDVFVAITSANVEREPLGLGNIWPKTVQAIDADTTSGDIGVKCFTNSSDYFYELYDGPNVGTVNHDPYVKGFDYSKLAGAGVPSKVGGGRLLAKNNMWIIAANITDEDDDIIPVLITRNVDVKLLEYIINHGGPTSNLNTRISLGAGEYITPFGDKGFVFVRKGGGTFNNKAKYGTLRVIFNSQTLPPRDPSKPPIVYLMP